MADHYREYDRPITTDKDDVDQFFYINWVLSRGFCEFDDVMDDPVEGCWARQTFRWISRHHKSRGDGRKEPGFVFPVDAPECCTTGDGKDTMWESKHCISNTWPVAC